MFFAFALLASLSYHQLLEAYLIDAQAEGQEWVQEWHAWLKSHYATLPPPAAPTPTAAAAAAAASDASMGDLASLSSASAATVAAAADDAAASDDQDESPLGPFYPGLFVSNLFDRLQNMHSNPFAINLALTGILAKMCYCPHPIAHAYVSVCERAELTPTDHLTPHDNLITTNLTSYIVMGRDCDASGHVFFRSALSAYFLLLFS